MHIKRIEIKNFRLLKNVSIELEKDSTLIVGKNNSGKTSFMDLLENIISNKPIQFYDYPTDERIKLYKSVKEFLKNEITFETLKNSILLPNVRIWIDYSLENENEILGALSPFIVDIDENISDVIIEVEYKIIITEENFKSLFENTDFEKTDDFVQKVLEENYRDLYKLNIYSIQPRNEREKEKIDFSNFQELFPFYKVSAERALDESEDTKKSPLGALMTSIFQKELDGSLVDIEKDIEELKEKCKNIKNQSQETINDLLSKIVEKSLVFGYPSSDELQLTARTNIDLEKQIQTSANLFYKTNNDDKEILPDKYNGLGYKNLIKIVFKLTEFSVLLKEKKIVSIPVVYIEEPEAHMHPQMQQSFIEYIDKFCSSLETKNIQVIITSHSSHILNSAEFSKIRYIKKSKNSIEIKNLNGFYQDSDIEDDTKSFLKKYLTLNKCDLFFCDKVILIEGTAERLLIPDMIQKLTDNGLLKGDIPLASQYYSLIEVGGAYAYKFIPLLNFLKIPSLIITDLDSVSDDGIKCLVSKGKKTSNATIKYWFKNILRKEISNFNDIVLLQDYDKTRGLLHIEYQIEENGLCGRSLEESLKNANRELYGLDSKITEEKLEYTPSKDGSKTDFALNLLFDEKKNAYNVPEYIKNGLVWLNEQHN